MWFERDQTFRTISQFDDGVFRVVNEVLVNSFFKHARVSKEMLYQGSDRKSINTYDTFMLISFTVGLYIHTRILFWLRTLTKIKRIQNIIPSSDDLSSPFLKRFWNHRVPINGYYDNAKKKHHMSEEMSQPSVTSVHVQSSPGHWAAFGVDSAEFVSCQYCYLGCLCNKNKSKALKI